jgi:hypothetical protein
MFIQFLLADLNNKRQRFASKNGSIPARSE